MNRNSNEEETRASPLSPILDGREEQEQEEEEEEKLGFSVDDVIFSGYPFQHAHHPVDVCLHSPSTASSLTAAGPTSSSRHESAFRPLISTSKQRHHEQGPSSSSTTVPSRNIVENESSLFSKNVSTTILSAHSTTIKSEIFEEPNSSSSSSSSSSASSSTDLAISFPTLHLPPLPPPTSHNPRTTMTIKEEERNTSEIVESRDQMITVEGTPSGCRTLRRPKKRPFSESLNSCCPVCSVTVRPSELISHFQQEVNRLEKIAKNVQRRYGRESGSTQTNTSRGSSSPSVVNKRPESRWEIYERIKINRGGRLSAKASRGQKRSSRGPGEDDDDCNPCPVCNEPLVGTDDQLNEHVEQCLKKQRLFNGSPSCSDDDEPVDVEGESYEEYDWAGETRIRVTSMIPGGLSSLGFQSNKKRLNPTKEGEGEEEEDLIVDGDDTTTFGQSQYNECDVIPCKADGAAEDRQRRQLRQAVIRHTNSPAQPVISSSTSSTSTASTENRKWNNNHRKSEQNEDDCGATPPLSSINKLKEDSSQVICSLKERISELETKQDPAEKIKCLICMEHYVKPVVSIGCWHVHCEECWLRTLGAKKLCPQCNSITSPTDLRRIYL